MLDDTTNDVGARATGPSPSRLGDENTRERVEIERLLEGVYRIYGFDFRSYAFASIRRRLLHRMAEEGLTTLSGLQERVLHDSSCMERLLLDLTVNVTSMFRDPSFYLSFRQKVVPVLRT